MVPQHMSMDEIMPFGAPAVASVPITMLPLASGAACLDGSPFGFYFVPSKTGSTKWTIGIQGGGWCYDEASCFERSHTRLGNSSLFPQIGSCGCMNTVADGLDKDCNCWHLPAEPHTSFLPASILTIIVRPCSRSCSSRARALRPVPAVLRRCKLLRLPQ